MRFGGKEWKALACILLILSMSAFMLPVVAEDQTDVDDNSSNNWFAGVVEWFVDELLKAMVEKLVRFIIEVTIGPTIILTQLNPCVYSSTGVCPPYEVNVYTSWLSFAASYLAIVAVEPLVTWAAVNGLKKFEDSTLVSRLFVVDQLSVAR